MALISSIDNIKSFFTTIQSIGFFGRLFSWGAVLRQHALAQNEMLTVLRELNALNESNQANASKTSELSRDLEHYKEMISGKSRDYDILNTSVAGYQERLREKDTEIGKLQGVDEKNAKRIIELERDSERFATSIQQLNTDIQNKESEIGKLRGVDEKNAKRIIELERDSERFATSVQQYNADIQEKESRIGSLQESESAKIRRIVELETENRTLRTDNIELERKVTSYQQAEQQQLEQYNTRITELNTLKTRLDEDQKRLHEERESEIKRQFEAMAETWRVHEGKVEEAMKGICSRHQVEYINKEQVPFKGKPDNTIRICEEFVIFDAKSPQNEDLQNFPTYLRRQAEEVRKYVKEKDVFKSLFLVVPSNTIPELPQFYHNMADYDVFVVTIDTLEPIIMSLKRIESYEYIDQLSPEERDSICRILGKFAHATKRRIQIDTYFCNEYINILNSCSALPEEIMEMTVQYEKADKMNPPMERRAKVISTPLLKKEVRKIRHEAEGQEINTAIDGKMIEQLPLYTGEENREPGDLG